MTDAEIAEQYVSNQGDDNILYFGEKQINLSSLKREAFLVGLKTGKEYYSKIYMQGRKDEREHLCSLCKNPKSICIRCYFYKTLCAGSDVGVYVGECKNFIYKEMKENDF